VNRLQLGIPSIWECFLGWLLFCGSTIIQQVKGCKEKDRKHPEIPILDDYRKKPHKDFWQKFPYRDIPKRPETKINTQKLEEIMTERRELLTTAQYERAKRVLKSLRKGAPSQQKSRLPAMMVKNEESSYDNGPNLTDTIADWVVEKFVAGPFTSPPLKDFRTNPLKVVVQNGKVRPVINASSPHGMSFNDNIREFALERVEMSSAARFGQSVLKAGRHSKMTKFDMKSAYKNVPCNIADLRLQGFEWCQKYFCETSQMFGATTAVSNFDILGNTVLALVMTDCEIPKYLVHRQIDDVPVVGPRTKTWCEDFTKKYADLCKEINVELAEDCPNMDKAFKCSTKGKVLGIEFNTEQLSWKLPDEKRKEYMNLLHETLGQEEVSVKTCQVVLGKLNFVCTMCPMMRTFKKPLQDFLTVLIESGQEQCPWPEEVRKDIFTWWKFLLDNKEGFPIPEHVGHQPLHHKTLTTDAAGWKGGSETTLRVGMGCVGIDEEGELFFANQEFWTTERTRSFFDKDGKDLGCKTTTLEFAGIVIPFLLCQEELRNQFVVVQVDNIGCHYAWENGYSKEDTTASILVRVLVCLAAKLSCIIKIVHHPRESSWESKLADRLSRERTTKDFERKLLNSFKKRDLPLAFRNWMDNPVEDWNLPVKLVQ